jgi:transposase
MKLKERISWLMGTVQRSLFAHLDECFDVPLTEHEKRLTSILEIVQVEKFVPKKAWDQWLGRKLQEREALARSFVAKALYKYPTTRALIQALHSTPNLRLICGFDTIGAIPSEATFSRAFAEFSTSKLGQRVHETLVKDYLEGELIGHISRDATAIVGREKPAKKVKTPKVPRKRGRPAKGEVREPLPDKRLDQQVTQTAEEALQELPVRCDRGTKKNAKGYKESWNGYKLHLDVNDTGLPISAVLTSASVHDSQVAIPLMKLTSRKVTYFYDLMDAAYDAGPIWATSSNLGHVPIIDRNPRGGEVIPMAPHEAVRYNERTSSERCNSRLKDDFGARDVMVKGAPKVEMHLMFGVITLFADQLLRLLA